MHSPPLREIRAVYTEQTIRVYQAYADPIADAALERGTFCGPFKMTRMTWIKPSFLWMMYRCGWAEKEGQTRVLAVDISRRGFEWALSHACLSHFDSTRHNDEAEWKRAMQESPVRVQWDPERDLSFAPLDYRSLQVGLSGEAVEQYVKDWISHIEDVTPLARQIYQEVLGGRYQAASELLPPERPYLLPSDIAAKIGML
ncbi:MAG: DUF4291 domain-containing protein [Verrucomicrobiota bacterium JB022]|nr:DUF4291 domain-containing protein [Verrucomicrobiota bacterium JB022]